MLILQVNIISSDKEAATLAPQAPSTSAKPTAHAWQAKSMLPMPWPPPTPQSASYYPIPTEVTTLLQGDLGNAYLKIHGGVSTDLIRRKQKL